MKKCHPFKYINVPSFHFLKTSPCFSQSWTLPYLPELTRRLALSPLSIVDVGVATTPSHPAATPHIPTTSQTFTAIIPIFRVMQNENKAVKKSAAKNKCEDGKRREKNKRKTADGDGRVTLTE